jgi:hypothetical protein
MCGCPSLQQDRPSSIVLRRAAVYAFGCGRRNRRPISRISSLVDRANHRRVWATCSGQKHSGCEVAVSSSSISRQSLLLLSPKLI